jgi:hypothetical protein
LVSFNEAIERISVFFELGTVPFRGVGFLTLSSFFVELVNVVKLTFSDTQSGFSALFDCHLVGIFLLQESAHFI